MLRKLNVNEQIVLRRNFSAFALDNDGFRYALATAKGADLSSFTRDADTSWKKSSTAAIEMIRRIKDMKPFSTVSILSLNESYQAVQQMCYVRMSRFNHRLKLYLKVLTEIHSNISSRKSQLKTHLLLLEATKSDEEAVKNRKVPIIFTKVEKPLKLPKVNSVNFSNALIILIRLSAEHVSLPEKLKSATIIVKYREPKMKNCLYLRLVLNKK